MQYDIEDLTIIENKSVRLCYKKGTVNFKSFDRKKNGILHNTTGPAVIYSLRYKQESNLDIQDEWWIEGIRQSPEKEKLLNIWLNNKR
jgi:hypothetical protein